MPTSVDGRDSAALDAAAERLAAGGLVAFPTETVYGLGARADDDGAVHRVFSAKDRPPHHPLIVHIASLDQVALFAVAAPDAAAVQALMAHFWPGPLTLILPRRAGVAHAAAAGQPTIGLRLPSHPVARELLLRAERLGVPGVAAPSANRHGRVSPTTARHVADEFAGADDIRIVDGGACAIGIESAIVDCSGPLPALLRPGSLDRRVIEGVLGVTLAAPGAASPRAPGTLASHYAPRARVVLFDSGALPAMLAAAATPPQGLAVYSRGRIPALAGVAHRVMPNGADAAAHELFAVLRAFDADGALLIWVERPPPGPEWDGVRDRLQRAAAA